MPAAVQRSTICPSRQRVTSRLVARAIEIIDSIGPDVVKVRARVSVMPSRVTVNRNALSGNGNAECTTRLRAITLRSCSSVMTCLRDGGNLRPSAVAATQRLQVQADIATMTEYIPTIAEPR